MQNYIKCFFPTAGELQSMQVECNGLQKECSVLRSEKQDMMSKHQKERSSLQSEYASLRAEKEELLKTHQKEKGNLQSESAALRSEKEALLQKQQQLEKDLARLVSNIPPKILCTFCLIYLTLLQHMYFAIQIPHTFLFIPSTTNRKMCAMPYATGHA